MSDIVVDTYNLKQYAQRLEAANRRINRIDRRLDSLYLKAGFVDLLDLLQAGILLHYGYRINQCQAYLQGCAADFERVEKELFENASAAYTGAYGLAIGLSQSDNTEQREKSGFAKFINNELKVKGAVLSGKNEAEGSFLGIGTAGSVSGSILDGEAGIKSRMSFKYKDNDGNFDFKSFGVSTEAKATGALAKGKVEGNFGYLYGSADAALITGAVSAEAKATLWDDGKFNPSLSLGAKAEGSVLQGSAKAGVGTDQYGVYAKADGDVLHAEAEAKAGVGYIGKGKDGNAQYGASAKASAMASVAQGKVKGGITIFGIDIDVGLKGYAGAAGVEAGASISTGGVQANFSGALALGAGLDISIDWSDAKWIGESVDAVSDFVNNAADIAKGVGSGIYDEATTLLNNVSNTLFGWW